MREPPIYTRQDLDGPTPLFIHAACHPSAGTREEYRDGVLHIRCRRCEKPIINIAVTDPRLELAGTAMYAMLDRPDDYDPEDVAAAMEAWADAILDKPRP